jgi:hypothetical protein
MGADGRGVGFGTTGLCARVIQRELEHLNGVLICDNHHPAKAECEHCPLEPPTVLSPQELGAHRRGVLADYADPAPRAAQVGK